MILEQADHASGSTSSGGTELVYQGRPTPQNPEIAGDDIDRAIEIIRERTDALGVSEPEIPRVGGDRDPASSFRTCTNAERAIDQVGDHRPALPLRLGAERHPRTPTLRPDDRGRARRALQPR